MTTLYKFKLKPLSYFLLAAFTIIASSNDLTKECQQYAIPSLCHYAFPLCDESSGKPKPRQICRDECEVLEKKICKDEYLIAQRHPYIGE